MCEQKGKSLGIYPDIDPCTVCKNNIIGKSIDACEYSEFDPIDEYKKIGRKLFA